MSLVESLVATTTKFIYSVAYIGCLERFGKFLFAPLIVILSLGSCIGLIGLGHPLMEYGIFLLREWEILFFLGWVSIWNFYRSQGDVIRDEIVLVDKACGIVLSLAMGVPTAIYIGYTLNHWFSYLCSTYLYCGIFIYYIGFVLGSVAPVLAYGFFLKYRPFPLGWIDLNLRNSFGTMCDDIVSVCYGTAITYILCILFFQGDGNALMHYIENLYRHMLVVTMITNWR